MLLIDYYFYFYNLEEYQRNREICFIMICLLMLLGIGWGIEKIRDKFVYKVKNEKVRKILRRF